MQENSSFNVILALKSSTKGQLKYDREWLKEGRTKDVLCSVANLNKIHLPKDISFLFHNEEICSKDKISNSYFIDNENLHTKPVPFVKDLTKDEFTIKEEIENDASKNHDRTSTCTNECIFEPGHETCSDIVSYEESRKKAVCETLKERLSKLEECGSSYFKQILNQIDLFRETQLLNQELQFKQLNELNELQLQDMDKQKQEMKDNQQRQAKKLGDKIKQAEQNSKETEERQKEEARINENARKLLYEYYEGLQGVYRTIVDLLSRCTCPELLNVTPDERKSQIKNVQDSLHQILEKKIPFTKDDFLQTQGLLSLARSIFVDVTKDVNNAKSKQNTVSYEENINAVKNEKNSPELHITPSEAHSTPSEARSTPSVAGSTPSEAHRTPTEANLLEIATNTQAITSDPAAYKFPVESQTSSKNGFNDNINQLKKNHDDWKSKYQQFLDDSSLKKYRFDLQKAINTPVNSISSISGEDLIEKIKKLIALLSGRNVIILTSNVSINNHPSAIYYCADKIAMKLVSFAEVEVSSHRKSAFTLAAVAVTLWAQYPKVGELLLFHLYSRCPYLIPESVVLPKDVTDEIAMFQARGFLIVDGEIEKDDEFLKRMTGIVRFYAAILVTMPAPQLQFKVHPHGLRHGWQLLSRMLRTKPWQDITATLLFHFLEVCGHQLLEIYGEQFKKILYIICKDYFQLLKQENGDKRNGPIARLESFLQNTLLKGRISPPPGLLNTQFWYTKYT